MIRFLSILLLAGFAHAEEPLTAPLSFPEQEAPPPVAETPYQRPEVLSAPADPVKKDSQAESQNEFEFDVRPFDRTRPIWAFQASGALNGLQGNTFESSTLTPYGASLSFEFQPPWIQAIGVLGIGPTASLFIPSQTGVTSSPLGIFSLGGVVRYQAFFFKNQPIVPMAAFEMQYLRYALSSGTTNGLLVSGPTFGLWILLNFIDGDSASQMYLNTGISRSYLTAEVRFLSGSDSSVTIASRSYFFGLRFEL